MSDIVKKINRAVPVNERTVKFTEADASQGDVIRVSESLGRPASQVSIDAVADLSVRFNVYHKVYPASQTPFGEPYLAGGVEVKDDTVALIELSAGDTFEIDAGFHVDDIELVAVSGVFEIFLS